MKSIWYTLGHIWEAIGTVFGCFGCFLGGHYPSLYGPKCGNVETWTGIVPAIITSEMTQNDFKMTLTPCEKHLVHLRTHLGSYWDSCWLLFLGRALSQSIWTGSSPHGLGWCPPKKLRITAKNCPNSLKASNS
jgi:hypothetical protein